MYVINSMERINYTPIPYSSPTSVVLSGWDLAAQSRAKRSRTGFRRSILLMKVKLAGPVPATKGPPQIPAPVPLPGSKDRSRTSQGMRLEGVETRPEGGRRVAQGASPGTGPTPFPPALPRALFLPLGRGEVKKRPWQGANRFSGWLYPR